MKVPFRYCNSHVLIHRDCQWRAWHEVSLSIQDLRQPLAIPAFAALRPEKRICYLRRFTVYGKRELFDNRKNKPEVIH